MTHHNCDLCGSDQWVPVHEAYDYIDEAKHLAPVICQGCGFVYVAERRTSAEIAKDWDTIWGDGYSSKWPMVQARLYYVAEWFEQEVVPWAGKTVLDVGAGEGDFARMILGRGAVVTGIEPCETNVRTLMAVGVFAFHGAIETYLPSERYDVTTILWTLENCGDCIDMLKHARANTRPGGHIVVATGSRILVPFKKPLSHYFSNNPQDLHSFRFSRNTLAMAMLKAGIEPVKENRWLDGDWLVMAGTVPCTEPTRTEQDDPAEVARFFESWAREWP